MTSLSLFVALCGGQEKQDRIALMGEVTILRETNQRLWEESISSNEKLCKLSLLFNMAPGMVPREREKCKM
jgi:hypothetical protein